MKKNKLIAMLLSLLLLLSFSACGESTETTDAEQPQTIDLTTSNINQYIEIKTVYGECETSESIIGTFSRLDSTIEIYPVVNASFANVEITMEVTAPSQWKFVSSDPLYNEDNPSTIQVSFILPASGDYTDSPHKIEKREKQNVPSEQCGINIISVSGTVTTN